MRALDMSVIAQCDPATRHRRHDAVGDGDDARVAAIDADPGTGARPDDRKAVEVECDSSRTALFSSRVSRSERIPE
jgi:hypothetical protein